MRVCERVRVCDIIILCTHIWGKSGRDTTIRKHAVGTTEMEGESKMEIRKIHSHS